MLAALGSALASMLGTAGTAAAEAAPAVAEGAGAAASGAGATTAETLGQAAGAAAGQAAAGGAGAGAAGAAGAGMSNGIMSNIMPLMSKLVSAANGKGEGGEGNLLGLFLPQKKESATVTTTTKDADGNTETKSTEVKGDSDLAKLGEAVGSMFGSQAAATDGGMSSYDTPQTAVSSTRTPFDWQRRAPFAPTSGRKL